MISFMIDGKNHTHFPHYWEECVGSCHAYTALRADYQEQLKKTAEECGFKYVRFHGLFNDDMCVVVDKSVYGEPPIRYYNFVNIDKIVDYFLSIGVKPFFELGFMPTPLASGTQTCFHFKGNVTMPKDMEEWKSFIKMFVEHLIERYGIEECNKWFFEVWNEPNLPLFFAGTKEDYFKLYKGTVEAIKEVAESLKVGGPATSFNSWIPETIEFCETNNIPLDFISTHHYPSDDPLWQSGADILDFFKEHAGEELKYGRGVLKKMTTLSREQAKDYPLYYTEWNVSSTFEEIHDDSYSAAMITKIIADNDGLVDGYSFWTFTDIFEEFGQHVGPFHGGFGMQTVQGIEKPVYRAFQLLHQSGNKRYKVISNSNKDETVEVLALNTEFGLRIFMYNHNVPSEPIEDEEVKIVLEGFSKVKNVYLQKIDKENANSYTKWKEIGSPIYPKSSEVEEMKNASKLKAEEYDKSMSIKIPANSLYVFDVHLNN